MKEHLKKTGTDEGLDDLVERAHRDMLGAIEDAELRFRVAKELRSERHSLPLSAENQIVMSGPSAYQTEVRLKDGSGPFSFGQRPEA